MKDQVVMAMDRIRPKLRAKNSDAELISTTDFGVVTVALSGDCCTGRLKRLLTIIDIEEEIKKQVPEIKVVIEHQSAHAKRAN